MTGPASPTYLTRRIDPADPASGFRCGKHPLDDYFRRHALPNDQGNIGLAYVVDASADDVAAGLPTVIGFYTLSMAAAVSADVGSVIARKLPRYPMPVALIGRLAVDERARGRRLGEALLLDALLRVITAAEIVGCLGTIVDAKTGTASASTRGTTSSRWMPRPGLAACSCRSTWREQPFATSSAPPTDSPPPA